MNKLLEIAHAVTESLADVGAEIRYTPEFELKNMAGRRVVVVPTGTEFRHADRKRIEETHMLSVGVVGRCREDGMEEMLGFCDGLAKRLLYGKFAGSVCMELAFNPLYSPEHIRERAQFTCVMELKFRAVTDA